MSDPFYDSCEKHSARRCMLCQKERAKSSSPTPVTDKVRARIPDPIAPGQIVDVTDEELKSIINECGSIQPAPNGSAESYQNKFTNATTAYLSAYLGYQNAKRSVVNAQQNVEKAKQEELDLLAQREVARNDLFDLISEDVATA